MKRVKIMLTSIAVLAVVGGALAFKASKFTDYCVYSYNAASKECQLQVNKFYKEAQPGSSTIRGTVVNFDGDCATPTLPLTTPSIDCTTITVTFE